MYFARNVRGPQAEFCADFEAVRSKLAELAAEEGRPLLVLGAGDIHKLIPMVLNAGGAKS